MTIREQVKERLRQIKLLSNTATNLTDEEIAKLPQQYVTEWSDLLNQITDTNPQVLLAMGRIISHKGNLYRVQQTTYINATQPPDGIGMYSIYRLYRNRGEYEWVQGEYCVIGDIRTVTADDVTTRYVAFQDPNTNIYSPETVPSVWEVVMGEE